MSSALSLLSLLLSLQERERETPQIDVRYVEESKGI
jgi:hypothetical protein